MFNISIAQNEYENALYNSRGNQINIAQIIICLFLSWVDLRVRGSGGLVWKKCVENHLRRMAGQEKTVERVWKFTSLFKFLNCLLSI